MTALAELYQLRRSIFTQPLAKQVAATLGWPTLVSDETEYQQYLVLYVPSFELAVVPTPSEATGHVVIDLLTARVVAANSSRFTIPNGVIWTWNETLDNLDPVKDSVLREGRSA
jgi:hypothetical protein